MKVEITDEYGSITSVTRLEVVTTEDALDLVRHALMGAGFPNLEYRDLIPLKMEDQ